MRKRAWLAALVLLAGCASHPRVAVEPPPEAALATLPEPGSDEVVVVENANAFMGRHAGIFVGARLSDPSGSYMVKRSGGPAGGPATLQDYVRYQLLDGPLIRLYRFRLEPEAFAAVAARQRAEGLTPPMFCAAGVQNLIAGVGPFREIPDVWWTTPSELEEHLMPLTTGADSRGRCVWANGRSCTDEGTDRALTLHTSREPAAYGDGAGEEVR